MALEESSSPAQHQLRTGGGGKMQNDIDLIRKILASIRDRDNLAPLIVEVDGYDPIVVGRHVERLHDDGLIEGRRHHYMGNQVATIRVRDLSSAGHEFLAALESGDVWERIKTALTPGELGALSFRQITAIAKELAVLGIKKKLGLD